MTAMLPLGHVESSPSLPLSPTARSERIRQALDQARAGNRAVALTGHTGDALVAENGAIVRLPEYLALWATSQGADLVELDPDTGARTLTPPGRTPVGPPVRAHGELVDQLRHVSRELPTRQARVCVFIDFACLHLDDPLLRGLLQTATDPAWRGHQLIAAFRTTAAPPVISTQPGWVVIDAPTPDHDERAYVLHYSNSRRQIPLGDGIELDGLATTLGGVSADGLLRLADEARACPPLEAERIIALKRAEIRRAADGTVLLDDNLLTVPGIAGLANLRLHVERCLQAGTRPGAILLAGPPGTGKTLAWRWLAWRLRLPAARFGRIRDRYVGDSDNNMARARSVLEGLSPSTVLIDECDQVGFGRRDTDLDGGVSARLRAEMFDLINSCVEHGLTFVLTTNAPHLLDPAALDRVTVLPVLPPTVPGEALHVLRIEAARQAVQMDEQAAAHVLAAQRRTFTGRQLVRLLREAILNAAAAGHPGTVTGPDVAEAAADLLDIGDPLAQEAMSLAAISLTESRAALPWVAAERLGLNESCQVPPVLRDIATATGDIDMAAVHRRLTQLRQAGHGV